MKLRELLRQIEDLAGDAEVGVGSFDLLVVRDRKCPERVYDVGIRRTRWVKRGKMGSALADEEPVRRTA